MKVYLVSSNELESMFVHVKGMTDEDFMDEAERQGYVYSLEGFQKAFNNGFIDEINSFIRFLNQ